MVREIQVHASHAEEENKKGKKYVFRELFTNSI